MRHIKVRVVGTWGADVEAREVGRDGLLLRELARPLKQAVECMCCHRKIRIGWLREDGLYFCRCCIHVEGREMECHHKGANKHA